MYRCLDEGPVVVSKFDDGMHHARRLDGDRSQHPAPHIGILPLAGGVALEPVAESVLSLPDSDQSGQLQGSAQVHVSVDRPLGLPAKNSKSLA